MRRVVHRRHRVYALVRSESLHRMCSSFEVLDEFLRVCSAGTPPFNGKKDQETLLAVKSGSWKFHEKLFKHISSDVRR